ncbi:MAG TPA: amidase [Xanthobacteraceae bacterium]|nr:amidase [Xanthobacteraceae bacterium]
MNAREKTELALAKIADPNGEGARTCLTVYAETARAAADAADARAKAGISLGPLDGAIVSIKDLFDVAGEPTRAGSKILADAPPAKADAPVVRRLRAAGAVIVAKTSMSEFAFSGVGMNPHYGTPGNPADRTRVPGGSSSGAAVAAADHMCEIAIGTDTGGSTRIPGALCGIVGFKPSAWRVPTEGAFPLSYSLDSIGPIARTVEDCAKGDAVMAGEEYEPLSAAPVAGLRLGVPQGLLLTEWDNTVGTRFGAARKRLSDAGVRITDEPMPLIDAMVAVNQKGGLAPSEAFSIHRDYLVKRADEFDPNVRVRIERGGKVSAADYIDMSRQREQLIDAMDAQASAFDAWVLPTTPIVAPTIAEMQDTSTFGTKNMLLLRNTSTWNFFDMCAISIPIPGSGLPVGLMLVARNGHDRRLFEIAAGIERLFAA